MVAIPQYGWDTALKRKAMGGLALLDMRRCRGLSPSLSPSPRELSWDHDSIARISHLLRK